VIWIGKVDEGWFMLLPISGEGFGVFETNDDDLAIERLKARVILTQLRHMPTAKNSYHCPGLIFNPLTRGDSGAETPIPPLVYERDHLLIKPRLRRYPMSAIRPAFWKDVVME